LFETITGGWKAGGWKAELSKRQNYSKAKGSTIRYFSTANNTVELLAAAISCFCCIRIGADRIFAGSRYVSVKGNFA
jgi:hypothetical protein